VPQKDVSQKDVYAVHWLCKHAGDDRPVHCTWIVKPLENLHPEANKEP